VDDELEVIRSQMEETRASLAEKLDALENKVIGGVEDTASAVTATVETVQETVKNVKETLNVRKHVRERPWTMMGGAFGLGFIGGLLLPKRGGAAASAALPPPSAGSLPPDASRPSEGGGLLAPVLQALKDQALGTVFQAVRDMAVKALPATMAPQVAGWVDEMAAKMGVSSTRPAAGEAPEREVVPFPQEEWGPQESKKENGARRAGGASRGFKPR